MASCVACDTQLPDGAAFCSRCGNTQIPAARGSLIDPSARRAAEIASSSAQSFIAEIGVDRAVCIVGGLLGLVGSLLPYVTIKIPTGTLPVSAGAGLTLVSFGAPGVIVLLIAIVLGGGSVVFRPSRAFSFVGIGLSTLVLSKVFGDWFTIGFVQAAVQAMGSLAPSSQQFDTTTLSQYFGAGAGFYCLLLGFAALFVAYARLAGASRTP